jgi:hypothetical protein
METPLTPIADDDIIVALRITTDNTWNFVQVLLSLSSSRPHGINSKSIQGLGINTT